MNITGFPRNKAAIAVAVSLALVSAGALAYTSTGNNFTMLDGTGAVVDGTNDVTFIWDGTFNTSASGTNFNATIASPQTFFGNNWTAHDIRIFGPGTYTINTACTAAQIQAGTCAPDSVTDPATTTNYTFTVGAGQIGAHMLFDWSVNSDIDVVQVWDRNATFAPSSLAAVNGMGTNSASEVWGLMSADADGGTTAPQATGIDSINGIPMIDGAFIGFNANFNLMVPNISGTFAAELCAALNSTVTSTNAITVKGIGGNAPGVDIGVSGAAGSKYSVSTDGGTTWSAFSATTSTFTRTTNDLQVKVQHTAANANGGTATTTLSVGGIVTTDFTSTATTACTPDTQIDPATMTFGTKTGTARGVYVESNNGTISGINTLNPTTISSITPGSEYAISSNAGVTFGAWSTTTGVTVLPGDVIKVRHLSDVGFSTPTTTTISIGSPVTNVDFISTTEVQDLKVNPFLLADLASQNPSTLVESAAITVTGINDATPIAVSGAGGSEFAISTDGGATWGAWYNSSATGITVSLNNRVKVRHTTASGAGATTDTILTIGTGGNAVSDTFTSTTMSNAAISSTGNNFTMLDANGSVAGGTNDVVFSWDGTYNTDPATAVSNATLSSVTKYNGFNWTAYNVKVYSPGNYTISTADTKGGPGCPNGLPICASGGNYSVTVLAGQVMAHMKFAWNTTEGIDVIVVWDANTAANQVFSPSSMFMGPGGSNAANTDWDMMSRDVDGDGKNGYAMIDGPFIGFSANFNVMGAGGGTGSGTTTYQTVPSEAPKTKTEGKGWCSISTMPVSPMERGDWWLIAGFLGWLAAVRRKFARSSN